MVGLGEGWFEGGGVEGGGGVEDYGAAHYLERGLLISMVCGFGMLESDCGLVDRRLLFSPFYPFFWWGGIERLSGAGKQSEKRGVLTFA